MARINTAGGLALGYVEAGGGDALPLVFLHGVGSDKSVWRLQLDHFARSRRAIAFDYPGYGESDRAPEETSREDYASTIWSALDALRVEKAHICGLSLGGVIAIALHAQAPHRCASLTLADTFVVHPEGAAIHQRSVAASADMAALAEARTPILLASSAAAELHAEVRETMSKIDPAAFRIGARAVWLADQRRQVRDIGVPTLVLCGDADVVTPPELSRELADAIPAARLEIIIGAGHLTNIERPTEFNRLVETFIKETERG